jgi:hypothetical protein
MHLNTRDQTLNNFLMPKQSDIAEALLKWFKQEISHIVAVSVTILMTALFLNFKRYCIF